MAKMTNKYHFPKRIIKINYKGRPNQKMIIEEVEESFLYGNWARYFPRRRYFYNNIFVVLCEKICDGAMEAYLHFIIETGLKKHHTLMELYWNVFSITVQMQTDSGQTQNNLSNWSIFTRLNLLRWNYVKIYLFLFTLIIINYFIITWYMRHIFFKKIYIFE